MDSSKTRHVGEALKEELCLSSEYKAPWLGLLSVLALVSTEVFADSSLATASASDPQAQTQTQTAEKRKTLIAAATSAIQETQMALKELDDRKPQAALMALERATGKLDIILARDPKLELAPAGVNVTTYDIQGGLDAVKKARKQAEQLMEDGRLQESRRLLQGLASETVISVSNIPLATYPDAIKSAAKLIDQDKVEEAKRVLQTALNTQVVIDTVIPLPVTRATESLKSAETLAEKKNRTQEDNNHLKAALDQARTQLEFAQALGYGTKNSFDKMYQQLNEIEEKTANNKFGTGFFAKIKASIAEFMQSTQSTKH